ncbi:MAG: chemotaxis protein CheW [Clostridiales bacterium]|jgi:purine-binding chemotaxis protein CheW|nr:chemotaxis protein CheW [Eubacteriales bacterium]MDH7565292.1 chemotaxis protein CheW [Clostridiales bacterium]
MGEMLILVFSLGRELWGADISQVQEVADYGESLKDSQVPDFVEGVINLRGKPVPVVSLSKRFGMDENEVDDSTKIIVTETEGKTIGYIVNDVSEIIRLSEEERETPSALSSLSGSRHLKCIGKKDGRVISVLDLEQVLKEEEIRELS